MSLRQQRMADEIRDLVAVCLTGGTMADPRLSGVNVTAAKVSPDFTIASLYFRVIGEDAKRIKTAQAGLESAAGYFRKRLSEALDVRRVPNLRFFYDESVERGARIEELLKALD